MLFEGHNCYANAPQCYVIRTFPVLLLLCLCHHAFGNILTVPASKSCSHRLLFSPSTLRSVYFNRMLSSTTCLSSFYSGRFIASYNPIHPRPLEVRSHDEHRQIVHFSDYASIEMLSRWATKNQTPKSPIR